ncbi:MAG: inner membrane protein alx [Actinomycetota bacterium]
MDIPLWLSIGTAVGFVLVLLADFFIVDSKPHTFTTKDAAKWVAVYVGLAIGFAALLFTMYGTEIAGQFVAGYLTEYSLSVDNLFVFLVIMTSFAVPATAQHRVLLVGVILALVLRAMLIMVGVSAIHAFEPVFLLFGAFLLWTAYKVATDHETSETDIKDKPIVRLASKIMPTHHEFVDNKLVVLIDGVKHLTPMALVMLAIGGTDIMFALDSIPAVLGLTSEPFLVLTSNAFALMGLRQLYFLLNTLIARLVHLARGLAIILAFIGIKLLIMGFEAATKTEILDINTFVSLGVIIVVLTVTTITSLYASRKESAITQASIDDAE